MIKTNARNLFLGFLLVCSICVAIYLVSVLGISLYYQMSFELVSEYDYTFLGDANDEKRDTRIRTGQTYRVSLYRIKNDYVSANKCVSLVKYKKGLMLGEDAFRFINNEVVGYVLENREILRLISFRLVKKTYDLGSEVSAGFAVSVLSREPQCIKWLYKDEYLEIVDSGRFVYFQELASGWKRNTIIVCVAVK